MRKTMTITIQDEGRDKGKVFVAEELPALRAEKWGLCAMQLMVRAGVQISDDALASGISGVASAGIGALFNIPFAEAEPLLDEMLGCIKIRPDPRHPEAVRAFVEGDIEEIQTLFKLRMAVLNLHLDFSKPAVQSMSGTTMQEPAGSEQPQTSPQTLPRASRPARPHMPNSTRS